MKHLLITANRIFKMLTLNLSNRLIKEFVRISKEEEIYLEDSGLLPRDVTLTNYTDKYNVQKNIVKKDIVIGYEDLTEGLRVYNGENVHLFTMAVSDSVFIFFVNEDISQLIGVIRSYNQNRSSILEMNKIYRTKGLDVNGITIKPNELIG